jgi:hypothetical protein
VRIVSAKTATAIVKNANAVMSVNAEKIANVSVAAKNNGKTKVTPAHGVCAGMQMF